MSSPNPSFFYDELPLWSAPFGLTLLDTVRMRPDINVLDIGSGSGFPMLELAERMGKSCMIYGLDPSADSIGMVNAKKEYKGIVNARILRGVAEEIPFPDEYFGLIVSNNGLNNVQDQAASLAECFRVADKDAQMVLTMNLPYTMIEFYEIFEGLLTGMGLTDEVKKMHVHIDEKRKPVEFLKSLIEASGFTIRSINVDGFKLRYNDGSAFLNNFFIRKAFMEPWKSILPSGQTEEIFNLLEEKLNETAGRKGELIMSIPYACFDCEKKK
ncbi:MAG: class I SAM-dependent methyltransferase [Bacteroidales bacterium]|jgi:SAM-dependent methyltransferase|nr:class I SAM-dependent methyltransferase [Bacteroidales bacterium]